MVPLAARTFVNRCRPGSTGSFQGTAVHKALRGLAVYTGLSNKCGGIIITTLIDSCNQQLHLLVPSCNTYAMLAYSLDICSVLISAATPLLRDRCTNKEVV